MKYNHIIFNLIVGFNIFECSLEPYIAGGDFTTYSKHPHSILLDFSCDGRFICGGSILNQNIILTAAHCSSGCDTCSPKSEDIAVKYGHEEIEKMKTTYVTKYVQHQDYDDLKVIHDICLMMTLDKIALSDDVKRVIIMNYPPIEKFGFGYVAGWGVDENEEMVTKLKYTGTQIQTSDVCARMGELPPGVFCTSPIAGLEVGAADEGDSGSALVIDDYIQIGLVSYKLRRETLVAYTNVSYYLDWIKRQSARLYCD